MATNTIKKHRERLGMTREKLATLIGKSYSTVVAYEQGTRDPDTITWQKLAEIFDTSLDELTVHGRKADGTTVDLTKTWPEVARVLQECSPIPASAERRRIARIIRAALEKDID